MRREHEHEEDDERVYDGRPIMMTDESLKEKLRRADAECLVRKHEHMTGRQLTDTARKSLEGIAFHSLSAGNTERDVLNELRKVNQ